MKKCPKCARDLHDAAVKCTHCGFDLLAGPSSDLADNAVVRAMLPVGRSGWAIAAGYLGLFSLLLAPAPLAVIVGVIAIVDLKRHPKKYGYGRALTGIVLGLIGTVLLVWMYVRY